MTPQKQHSVASAFWSSASERQSLALAFVGIAVSLLTYFVAKDATTPLWLTILIIIFFIVIFYIMISSFNDFILENRNSLPKVRAVIAKNKSDKLAILLLDPNELFGIFSRVSIYHKDSSNQYELLIAYGHVLTIQGDGKIQVQIEEWVCEDEAIVDGILNQSKPSLENTIVKPSAPAKQEERKALEAEDIDRIFAMAWTLRQGDLDSQGET